MWVLNHDESFLRLSGLAPRPALAALGAACEVAEAAAAAPVARARLGRPALLVASAAVTAEAAAPPVGTVPVAAPSEAALAARRSRALKAAGRRVRRVSSLGGLHTTESESALQLGRRLARPRAPRT